MKKFFIIILALILVLSLSACGGSMGDVNDKTPTDTPVDEPAEMQSNEIIETEEVVEDDVTIEEKVIYEGNDIKITATGLNNDGFFGPEVKVLIENNSAQGITVQSRNSSVNGLMVDTMFSADVATGKKANDTITFSSSDLEISGITTIKDIEFSLVVMNSDTWDDIVATDMIVLTTTADESFVQEYDDSGFVAYNADGIKVVVKKLNSSDSFWGSDVHLYIENNTTNNISVQSRDVSINGFMVDPIFSCDVMVGKKAFDTMTFMESDLTDNGITDITDLEFKLHIFDSESWDTIKDSDSINISFN